MDMGINIYVFYLHKGNFFTSFTNVVEYEIQKKFGNLFGGYKVDFCIPNKTR